MIFNRVNHSSNQYNVGKGLANVNIKTGSLIYEHPLLSIGKGNFQIDTSIIYNSQYKNYNIFDRKIGYDNGWKLNIQEYVFPYLNEYNIDGFESSNYVYIDAYFNVHRFVLYKTVTKNNEELNVYYDDSGTGLRLYVGSDTLKIVDSVNSEYHFNSSGNLITLYSGINSNIKKVITYDTNGNITSIYDERKEERKIRFSTDNDNLLTKVFKDLNDVTVSIEYDEKNITKIKRSNTKFSKYEVMFKYSSNGFINNVISLLDLTGLNLGYERRNSNYLVYMIKEGVFKHQITKTVDKSECFIGDDLYLGDDKYLNDNYEDTVIISYIMNSSNVNKKTIYNYTDFYTDITVDDNNTVRYYLKKDGTVISNFEVVNGKLYTLFKTNGWRLSSNGGESVNINGNKATKLDSSYKYIISNNLDGINAILENNNKISANTDNEDKTIHEHFKVSFWLNINGVDEKPLRLVFSYKLNEDNSNIKTTNVMFTDAFEGQWQYVTIPLTVSKTDTSISDLTIEIMGLKNSASEVMIADVRIEKGSTPEIIVFEKNGDNYREVKLDVNSSIIATGMENNGAYINYDFYLTQNDILETYKNMFLSDDENFDLVCCGGTRVYSISDMGAVDSEKIVTCKFNGLGINDESELTDPIPNYYIKLIDIINNDFYYVYEEQTRLHPAKENDIGYYEVKKSVGLLSSLEEATSRLPDSKANLTYNWQNFNGTFRARKESYEGVKDGIAKQFKKTLEYIYDDYGNVTNEFTSIEEDNVDSKISIQKITYDYGESIENRNRQNIFKIKKDKEEIAEFTYDENDNIIRVSQPTTTIAYIYDSFNENILKYGFFEGKKKDVDDLNGFVFNEAVYYENGLIRKLAGNNNIIYDFKYNNLNNTNSVYKNNNIILQSSFDKLALGHEETSTIYQSKTNPSNIKQTYDKYGRVVNITDSNNSASFDYEEANNYSKGLGRTTKIEDEFSGKTYSFSYDDLSDKPCQQVNVTSGDENNCEMSITTYSPNNYKYKINQGNEYNVVVNQEDSLSKNVREYVNKMNDAVMNDFTYIYSYDSLNRYVKKENLANVYDEAYISLEKQIVYNEANKDLPAEVNYYVNSQVVNKGYNRLPINYKNEYDSDNNIIKFIKGGTRYIENPTNEELTATATLGEVTYEYKYDIFNRLIEEKVTKDDVINKYNYIYNENGLLINVALNDNIIKTFNYDKDRLTSIKENDIISNVNYDDYGNVICSGSSNYTYNSRNLVDTFTKKVGNNNILEFKYKYNYQGIRCEKIKTIDSEDEYNHYKVKYHLDGSRILGEDWTNSHDNLKRKMEYFYDAEGICGIRYNDHNFTLIKDSLGNVSKVMYQGKVIGEYEYNAWGECTVIEHSIDKDNDAGLRDRFVLHNNPFRYKGYYWDSESNLYYCNYRYYSPVLCRWLSPDSIEYLDPESFNGLNLYCYCLNNPIMYVDYTGKFPVPIDKLITGVDHSLGLYKLILDQSIKGSKPKKISIDLAKKIARKSGHKQSARAVQRSIYNSTDDVIKNTIKISKSVDDFLDKFGTVVFFLDSAWTIGENIYNGNEHWFTDSAFEIARNAIPFIAGLVLSGGWSFFIPIGISIVQGVVDYFLEDEIDEFLNDFGDSWNNFWSFSWI